MERVNTMRKFEVIIGIFLCSCGQEYERPLRGDGPGHVVIDDQDQCEICQKQAVMVDTYLDDVREY